MRDTGSRLASSFRFLRQSGQYREEIRHLVLGAVGSILGRLTNPVGAFLGALVSLVQVTDKSIFGQPGRVPHTASPGTIRARVLFLVVQPGRIVGDDSIDERGGGRPILV